MMAASTTLSSRGPLKGRHVLFAFLGFFAVFASVDIFMIYRALSTFGGVDNVNAYRDGLAYNSRIAQGEQQDKAGWHDSLEVLPAPQRLRLSILNSDGRPVSDAGVHATTRASGHEPLRYRIAVAQDRAGRIRSRRCLSRGRNLGRHYRGVPAGRATRSRSMKCGGAYGSSHESAAARRWRSRA